MHIQRAHLFGLTFAALLYYCAPAFSACTETQRQAVANLISNCSQAAPITCADSTQRGHVVVAQTKLNSSNQTYTEYSCFLTWCGSGEPQSGMITDGPVTDYCSIGLWQAASDAKTIEKPICKSGSIVDVSNRVVGEVIPLVGTSFDLIYFSSFAPGRVTAYTVTTPLTKSQVSSPVQSYSVTATKMPENSVLDSQSFGPQPDQTYSYTWNGLDGNGVPTWGPTKIRVSVVEHASDYPTSTLSEVAIGGVKAVKLGLGGWMPSNWHFYSTAAGTLYSANGATRKVVSVPEGTLLRVPEDDGSLVHYFDSIGRIVYTKLGLTGQTIYTFNYHPTTEVLISITEPFGRVTTFNRDSNGVLTSITAPNGKVTSVTVGSGGYLASVTNPKSETYFMLYSGGAGLLTKFIKPSGVFNEFSYDAIGNLNSDSHSGGSSQTLQPTSSGIDLITAVGRVSKISSSNAGTDAQEIRPDGSTFYVSGTPNQTYVYDRAYTVYDSYSPHPIFNVQSRYLSNKTTSAMAGSRMVQVSKSATLSDPDNPFSIANFHTEAKLSTSSLKQVSNYSGSTRTMVTTSPLGKTRTTVVDQYQRVVSDQVGTRPATSFTYSGNKLSGVTQGDRTIAFTYDSPTDLLTSITNGLSETTSFSYDAAERLTSMTAPGPRTTGYLFDSQGNLLALTPPGRPVHLFTIGPKELVSNYAPPSLSPLQNYQTSYSYNNDNQLTQVNRPDGSSISFTYDSTKGFLNSVVAPSGNFSYTYNPSMAPPANIDGPNGYSMSFNSYLGILTYSSLRKSLNTLASYSREGTSTSQGKVTKDSVIDAAGVQFSANYGYDEDELLTSAGALTISRTTSDGDISGTTLGTLGDSFGYNSFGEVTSYRTFQNAGDDLFEENYTRDQLGRITQRIYKFRDGPSTTFNYLYDSSGRLIEVKKNMVTQSTYEYDANGNRIGGQIRGQPTTATYDDQDRMTQRNVYSYAYNLNGELVSKTNTITNSSQTYSYDSFGNLTQVVTPQMTVGYDLDPLGRRVARKVNSVIERYYYYDLDGRLVAELSPAKQVIRRYVYGTKSHVPDYYVQGGVNYRMITDYLGSLRMVVNSTTGEVVQAIEYDEFGRVVVDTKPGFTPFGFAGGIYDCDTKLVHFGAREYDPESGRWSSKDPILFNGGDANLYGYVLNDPINFIDPTGKSWRDVDFRSVLGGTFLVGGGIALVAGGTAASGTGVGVGVGIIGTFVGAGAIGEGGLLLINEWNNLIYGPDWHLAGQSPAHQPEPIQPKQTANACRWD